MAAHELVNLNSNPIVFHYSPGTLETIAATKLALMCWHQQLFDVYLDEENNLSSSWFEQHKFSSNDIFPLPDPIRDILDRRIKLFGIELYRFVAHYDLCLPTKNGKNLAICLEHLILQPNGLISYKSSARNLLENGKLSSMKQFRIACVFCFEEDIERLWPSVSDRIEKMEPFDDDYICHAETLKYWVYRLRDELDKIPGDVQESAEYRIMSTKQVHEWSEIEYFWDKLTPSQQIQQIKWILSKTRSVKYFLPKLNEEQWQYALKEEKAPSHILCGLAKNEVDFELALQVWSYMKDTITHRQFFLALDILLRLALVSPAARILNDHVAVLLFEVWQSAPEHLKKPVLKNEVEYIFNSLLAIREIDDYDMRWYGRDLRFLLDLFSNVESELRKKIWLENWRKLIMISKVSNLDQFMKLCFNDESEISQFKKQKMMNYKLLQNHFDKFIAMGFSRELTKYLEFCSSNDEAVRNLKKKIINSNLSKMHKFKFDALVKFDDFIVNSFQSLDLAYQFKEKLIRDRLDSWLDTSWVNGVKNIITCFLASDENLLTEFKQKCYERCQHHLKNGTFVDFSIRKWQEFLTWCAPSYEDLAQFKKSLPIDDAFNILLARAIKGQINSRYLALSWYKSIRDSKELLPRPDVTTSLIPVERFLQWYFESNEAKKTFKLSKIYKYKQMSAITDMLNEGDKLTIEIILNWFFDCDNVERQKFTDEMIAIEGDGWESQEDDSGSVEDEEMSEDNSQTGSASDEDMDEMDMEQID